MAGGHVCWGSCMTGGVRGRGHAWWGEHAWQGTCVVGGMCGRGHAWQVGMHGTHAPQEILRDTVNERAVRILLECILVVQLFRCSRCSGNNGRIP